MFLRQLFFNEMAAKWSVSVILLLVPGLLFSVSGVCRLMLHTDGWAILAVFPVLPWLVALGSLLC